MKIFFPVFWICFLAGMIYTAAKEDDFTSLTVDSSLSVNDSHDEVLSLSKRNVTAVGQPAECKSYIVLNTRDRAQVFNRHSYYCDRYYIKKKQWYRFMGAAGNAMPTQCVPERHCGTYAPGWLAGTNPTRKYELVRRKVCFAWDKRCCLWPTFIDVRNCGGFLVYQLDNTIGCSLRYCGNDQRTSVPSGIHYGKAHIRQSNPAGFYCQRVSFPRVYTGASGIRVFTSVNHGPRSSARVHDATFSWSESTKLDSSKVCMEERGVGSLGNATIDWIAVRGAQPGIQHGNKAFTMWTTGTKCSTIRFQQSFQTTPNTWVSARHTNINGKKDSMAIWTTGLTRQSFRVCMRETKMFSGKHDGLSVDWIAFDKLPLSLNFTEASNSTFAAWRNPIRDDNFASCKVVNLTNKYYQPPVIVLTSHISSEKYAVSSWIEEITIQSFRVCTKDLINPNQNHQEVTINYLVIGDIDPCTNVTCKYFAICRAFSAQDARCICPQQKCPSYQKQVCATNGQTFDNECLMEQHVCRIKGNFTFFHHGSCRGFPIQNGHIYLDCNPVHPEYCCSSVKFHPYSFYPDKDVHILATVSHYNHSGSVLDASSVWAEDVSVNKCTVCAVFAGRSERAAINNATIEWIAYQGAPSNGITGQVPFQQWWTGTTCKRVQLPKGVISKTQPTVLVTPDHTRKGLRHDASLAWTEDVQASGFSICLREMQNFDGAHEEIRVNWLVFYKLHRPLFSEHGRVDFKNHPAPQSSNNYAYCQQVKFSKTHRHPPTVLLTPSVTRRGKDIDGVTAWIENPRNTGMDVCTKQVYDRGYSPLTVHYAVLADVCGKDWQYFRGFCYKTSTSCLNWRASQNACAGIGANLTSVHSQEENVFIQQQHNGGRAWIGLSDIYREGAYVWADRSAVNYTKWAKNQPNYYRRHQDCVHALGVNQKYTWDDIACTSCQHYTCKKDYDECADQTDECDASALCINTPGSYRCECPTGYSMNGRVCNDTNECGVSNNCHVNATCTNTVGSHTCTCQSGFSGDGNSCADLNECGVSDNCHANATCTNTVGTYTCRCHSGFTGDGVNCTDTNECGASDNCHINATCRNTVGSFTCQCKSGFSGNGVNCADINECQHWWYNYQCRRRYHYQSECRNTIGSYTCRCKNGFSGNGYSCSDINECYGAHGCDRRAACYNTYGSYYCRCNYGYYGNGRTCLPLSPSPSLTLESSSIIFEEVLPTPSFAVPVEPTSSIEEVTIIFPEPSPSIEEVLPTPSFAVPVEPISSIEEVTTTFPEPSPSIEVMPTSSIAEPAGLESPISITYIIKKIKEVSPRAVVTNKMIAAIKQIIRGYYGGGCSQTLSCTRKQLINRIKNANSSIELANARIILGKLLNLQGGQGNQQDDRVKGILTATLNIVGQKQLSKLVAADGQETLAFAFDTTGSMSSAKVVVNELVKDITTAPRKYNSNFILSEFNDPGPQKVQEFTRAVDLAAAVSNLRITGGGDCPENATEGILNALTSKNMRAGSPLVVVTDATAKDVHGLGYINKEVAIAIANEIYSGITFLIRNGCLNPQNDPHYRRMLGATAGMMLWFQNGNHIKLVDDLVLALLDGTTMIGCGKSGFKARSATHEGTFETDPSIDTLIVQTKASGTIKLKNPSNSEMAPLVTQTSGSLWVIKAAASGEWKLESNQSTAYKAWGAATANIGFSQLFLKNLSSCDNQTTIPHPLQEEEAKMRLIVSRRELLDVSTIKVYVVSEDCMSVISEAKSDGQGVVTFHPSNSAFRLRLTATTKGGAHIVRYSRILQAQSLALTPKLTNAVLTLTPDTATRFSFYLFNNMAAETFKIEAFSSVGSVSVNVKRTTINVAKYAQAEGTVEITFPASNPARALYLVVKATGMTSGKSTVMVTPLVKNGGAFCTP